MAKKKTLFENMQANPKNNWGINDIKKLCDEHGLSLEPPSNGSHYKVVSPAVSGHVTVPARRPIKPCYIKTLIAYVTAHQYLGKPTDEKQGEDNG